MIVRPETAEDREASLAIERAAFETELEARIAEAIRDEPGSFALVADDDDVVGHVQLSRAWLGDAEILALGPIAVEPARQRQGVGTALVAAALHEARARGERAVILLGDPDYYGKRGFEPAGRHGVPSPFTEFPEEYSEHFQIAILDPSYRPAGATRWHPAFDMNG